MKIRFVPFDKLPYSDSCWSLIKGPDDCVYAAGCTEHTPGGTVYVTRYDPATEDLEYILDVAEVVGETPDTGRATQCKIHYSLLIDDAGIMYGATHLSGPAVGEVRYNPWATFDDARRSYVGARLFAYDVNKEEVLWTDTLIPWEGCRCMAIDQSRRCLYAVGYPRDHVYRYDLESHEREDLGRIGSVNPQVVWMDARNCAYTTSDDGHIVRIDPSTRELYEMDCCLPSAAYQNGWHSVIYDGIQVPEADEIAGITWNVDPRLFRFNHADEKVIDLGPAGPGIDGSGPRGLNTDHAGGLVFMANEQLLYGASHPSEEGDRYSRLCTLWMMDIETGEKTKVGDLITDDGKKSLGYVSRAARVGPRDVVFGVVGPRPSGLCHVTLPEELAAGPLEEPPRRYWG